LITLLGVVFIGMYIWEAVVSRIGDYDQSLIFWYLPILFIGAFTTVGGFLLVLLGLKQVRDTKEELQKKGRSDS
jgi:hypothetical protein